jgi:peptide/nickel transport system permease protein
MVGLIIVVGLVVCAVFAPLIAPYDPNFQHRLGLSEVGEPLGPGRDFKLGTDALGRDELSRLAYGARVSLAVGIGAGLLASLIGLIVGGVAGVAGGWVQTLLMRAMDVVLSFPILLLAIALLAVTETRLSTILLIIGISFGAYLARIVFNQTVSLKEREFVLAARTAGVGSGRILLRHILPHVMPSVIVYGTLSVATAILLEAALSYVGIGIQPPDASWGNMVSEGQSYLLSAPWLVAFAGGAVVLAMIGFSLLGDGLRDALDPTLERRSTRLLIGGVR